MHSVKFLLHVAQSVGELNFGKGFNILRPGYDACALDTEHPIVRANLEY